MREIAAGRGVKRADHDLHDPDGVDCTDDFLEALRLEGFVAVTVGAVSVGRDERIPAWLVSEGLARFGFIFWERFTPQTARKLWGSVHKNAKGDWDKMLGLRSIAILYVNTARPEPMDADNPSGW